jgi:hypothetical protein
MQPDKANYLRFHMSLLNQINNGHPEAAPTNVGCTLQLKESTNDLRMKVENKLGIL